MSDIYPNPTPDQDEHVVETDTGTEQHRERIVRDTGAAQRVTAYRVSQFIWLLFGILEGLIAIRIVLKFIAANPSNPFASGVYSFTDIFLWPFFGLTGTPAAGGMVLEIPSIIGMIVYALIGWVIVKLIWLLLYRPSTSRVETYDRDIR